jgi:NADPH-dependent glutamate synthase beta subunit-like oxidoreductase
MTKEKASGPHIRKEYTYKDLPVGATSIGIHEDVIKTGIWRFIRPVFKGKTPPCNEACPAGVDVRGFITLMKEERYDEAHQLYLEENPFPAICGRVCFHPCEGVCNRKDFDQAVAINALERFLADFESRPCENPPMDGGRVAIVGSGPTGMSCAYYLTKLGYQITVFEALEVIGGLLRTGIPSYRLPKRVVDKEVEKLSAMGVQFQTRHPINRESWKDLAEFDAVFLAYGANQDLPFDLSHEPNQGIISGPTFLRTVNLQGAFNLGNRVAVLGGGNTAIDAARVALRLGTSPTVIYRRSREEMPAFEREIEDALKEGVKILYLVSPVTVEKQGTIQKIECVRNRLGKPGKSGRRRPLPVEGSNFLLEADTVISAVGETPDLSFLPEDLEVSNMAVCVDSLGSTKKLGFFAGGDLIDQPRSVAHAIGSGKKAAIAIDCYLTGNQTEGLFGGLQIGRHGNLSFKQYREGAPSAESKEVVHLEDLNTSYFEVKNRSERPKTPNNARSQFKEIYGNLSKRKARDEAHRCFSCGMCYLCDNCYLFCPDSSVAKQEDGRLNVIDYEYCKGCGICENECPVGVIVMEKET